MNTNDATTLTDAQVETARRNLTRNGYPGDTMTPRQIENLHRQGKAKAYRPQWRHVPALQVPNFHYSGPAFVCHIKDAGPIYSGPAVAIIPDDAESRRAGYLFHFVALDSGGNAHHIADERARPSVGTAKRMAAQRLRIQARAQRDDIEPGLPAGYAPPPLVEDKNARRYDRQSINRHSERTYTHDSGARFLISRDTDTRPQEFEMWHLDGSATPKNIPHQGRQFFGAGLSWKRAEELAAAIVDNHIKNAR